MDRETFCNTVLSRVRFATEREREAIRRELEGHLEDHAADLVRIGWPENEAEERAMAAMGDPAEIGRALNREYPLGWLVLSRIALLAAMVLGLLAFAAWCVIPAQVFRNVQARTAPAAYLSLYDEEYGLDAVMETDIRVDLGDRVLWVYQTGLDTETGQADLLACLYHKNPLKKTQRDLLARAGESICADLRSVSETFSPGSFSCCISNPPYFSGGPASKTLPLARREDSCSLTELFQAAAWAIKFGGDFFLVHRPERLAELIAQGSLAGLEAKRLCLVRHREGGPVNLVLLQFRKGAKPGLIWQEWTLHHSDGSPTPIYQEIYHRKES